jgi:hypothetical protein
MPAIQESLVFQGFLGISWLQLGAFGVVTDTISPEIAAS